MIELVKYRGIFRLSRSIYGGVIARDDRWSYFNISEDGILTSCGIYDDGCIDLDSWGHMIIELEPDVV
jgi:hypothetical protein